MYELNNNKRDSWLIFVLTLFLLLLLLCTGHAKILFHDSNTLKWIASTMCSGKLHEEAKKRIQQSPAVCLKMNVIYPKSVLCFDQEYC